MLDPIIIYIGRAILTVALMCVIVNLIDIFVSAFLHNMNNKHSTYRTLTGRYVQVPNSPLDNKIPVMIGSVVFIYMFASIIVHMWM